WVQAWTVDDEIVPQPAVFGGEEEYWFQLAWQQAPTTAWIPLGGEEVVPQPIAFGLDEEYWLQFTWQPSPVVAPLWSLDDEIVPQPPLVAEEDSWIPGP